MNKTARYYHRVYPNGTNKLMSVIRNGLSFPLPRDTGEFQSGVIETGLLLCMSPAPGPRPRRAPCGTLLPAYPAVEWVKLSIAGRHHIVAAGNKTLGLKLLTAFNYMDMGILLFQAFQKTRVWCAGTEFYLANMLAVYVPSCSILIRLLKLDGRADLHKYIILVSITAFTSIRTRVGRTNTRALTKPGY